jgi:hypothetical protein
MDEYCLALLHLFMFHVCVRAALLIGALFHRAMKFFITRVNYAGRRGCAAPWKIHYFFASCCVKNIAEGERVITERCFFSPKPDAQQSAPHFISRGGTN